MRKKRNDFDAVGVERMTDAELSKKLGGYCRIYLQHPLGHRLAYHPQPWLDARSACHP